MIKGLTRGNRRSKEEQLRIMTDVMGLLPKHNDYEIMNILRLPNSTYYRYKSKIYEEAKKQWNQACKESLEFRALSIRDSFELCIKVNEEIARDSDQPAKDRLAASKILVEAQVAYLTFLHRGPDINQIVH
jgi:hypothetical protein